VQAPKGHRDELVAPYSATSSPSVIRAPPDMLGERLCLKPKGDRSLITSISVVDDLDTLVRAVGLKAA
jgi:hypothetical protein